MLCLISLRMFKILVIVSLLSAPHPTLLLSCTLEALLKCFLTLRCLLTFKNEPHLAAQRLAGCVWAGQGGCLLTAGLHRGVIR